MHAGEAIVVKALTGDEFLNADPDDIFEAERLSIEALKFILKERQHLGKPLWGFLPGETEK